MEIEMGIYSTNEDEEMEDEQSEKGVSERKEEPPKTPKKVGGEMESKVQSGGKKEN